MSSACEPTLKESTVTKVLSPTMEAIVLGSKVSIGIESGLGKETVDVPNKVSAPDAKSTFEGAMEIVLLNP